MESESGRKRLPWNLNELPLMQLGNLNVVAACVVYQERPREPPWLGLVHENDLRLGRLRCNDLCSGQQ